MRPYLFVLLLTQINSPAASLSDLSYVFINNESAVRIVGCNKAASGDLDIPSTINGLPVTEIEGAVFANCDSLVNITVPGSVSVITHGQFRGCDLLETVSFEEGVTELQKNVFLMCESLHTVQLPSSLVQVDGTSFDRADALTAIQVSPSGSHFSSVNGVLYNADQSQLVRVPGGLTHYSMPSSVLTYAPTSFGRNTQLASVSLGAGLTQLRAEDFKGCTAVTEYLVDAGSSFYASASGIVYDADGSELVLFPGARQGVFHVPATVTSIGNEAFSSTASKLSAVHIPEGLSTIGARAFSGCAQLSSVQFPASLTAIGNEAFSNCTKLAAVDLSQTSAQLGEQCFEYCTALSNLSLPSNLVEVPYRSFANCDSLTSVILPSGVERIGSAAFSEAVNLTEVHFSDALLEIGDEAFFACGSLAHLKLPEGLHSIGEYAFAENTKLVIVSLPESLTSLGEYSFEGCSGVASFILRGDAPLSDLDVLGFAGATTTVYYPSGKMGYDSAPSSVVLQSVDASTYAGSAWLLEHSFAYDTDITIDHNQDGVTLLEAYAFSLNPHSNLVQSLPALVLSENGDLDFDFSSGVAAVSYRVQTSADLTVWQDIPHNEVVDLGANRKRFRMQPEDAVKKYVRLRVDLQSAP